MKFIELDTESEVNTIRPFLNISFIFDDPNQSVSNFTEKLNSTNIQKSFIKFANISGLDEYLDISSIDSCKGTIINSKYKIFLTLLMKSFSNNT